MQNDPDIFLNQAKVLARSSYNSTHEESDQIDADQVFIVWFSKTLQNWKALVGTNIPDDEVYFEVTFNGDKNETYVDTYQKVDNQVVLDTTTESS